MTVGEQQAAKVSGCPVDRKGNFEDLEEAVGFRRFERVPAASGGHGAMVVDGGEPLTQRAPEVGPPP